MSDKMSRYEDTQKETLWEEKFPDNLYQGKYGGMGGIYKSPDGKYFFAIHRESWLKLISEEDAKKAIETRYKNCEGEDIGIRPDFYLNECGYFKD